MCRDRGATSSNKFTDKNTDSSAYIHTAIIKPWTSITGYASQPDYLNYNKSMYSRNIFSTCSHRTKKFKNLSQTFSKAPLWYSYRRFNRLSLCQLVSSRDLLRSGSRKHCYDREERRGEGQTPKQNRYIWLYSCCLNSNEEPQKPMIKPSYEIPGPETGAGCTCAWIEQNYLKKLSKTKKHRQVQCCQCLHTNTSRPEIKSNHLTPLWLSLWLYTTL